MYARTCWRDRLRNFRRDGPWFGAARDGVLGDYAASSDSADLVGAGSANQSAPSGPAVIAEGAFGVAYTVITPALVIRPTSILVAAEGAPPGAHPLNYEHSCFHGIPLTKYLHTITCAATIANVNLFFQNNYFGQGFSNGNQTTITTKIDQRINSSNHLTFRYTHSPSFLPVTSDPYGSGPSMGYESDRSAISLDLTRGQ